MVGVHLQLRKRITLIGLRHILKLGNSKNITTETTTNTTETIFKIIGNNPKVTAKKIASVCGITEDGVAYHIKKLKQSGRIIRIGGSRYGGEWKVIE